MFSVWFWGDPHFVTMDSQNYTFNGIGDFILLRNRTATMRQFEYQCRCDEFSPGAGATIFKAIGGYEGNSGTVEFKANNATSQIDVYYDNTKQNIGNQPVPYGNGAVLITWNRTIASAEFESGWSL